MTNDYLDNAAGDQASNTKEFQYYNADNDVGAFIDDHWVSFRIASNRFFGVLLHVRVLRLFICTDSSRP